MPQMIQLIDKDMKTVSVNIFHKFKKVEESISMIRHFLKNPYKTYRDRKQALTTPKMEGHTTSKWRT